jgi:hypothetical protein
MPGAATGSEAVADDDAVRPALDDAALAPRPLLPLAVPFIAAGAPVVAGRARRPEADVLLLAAAGGGARAAIPKRLRG